MKICYDARVIIDQQTGLGNYTFNLLRSLLEIDKKNLYVVFINKHLRKDHPIQLLEQPNLIKKIVDIPPVSVSQQYLLTIELLKEKPDLYHYPNWDVPVLHPFKSIFTIHDLTYLLVEDAYLNFQKLKKIYTRMNILLGIKRAKKIIAVSQSTKNDMLEIFKTSPNKVNVIYEACEEVFNNSKSTGKAHDFSNVDEEQFKYFLCVGERRPHKNLIRTIQAFNEFKKRYQNYKLIIIGKPYSKYNEPTQLVKKLHLSNDVIFYGYVPIEELIRFYKNAEALLFVSLYEGFGLPLLEAMACGTAIITSNVSATNEIAAEAAIKVNPYDIYEICNAMGRIVQDKVYKKELIEKANARKLKFSWLKAAEQTLALYEQVYNNL